MYICTWFSSHIHPAFRDENHLMFAFWIKTWLIGDFISLQGHLKLMVFPWDVSINLMWLRLPPRLTFPGSMWRSLMTNILQRKLKRRKQRERGSFLRQKRRLAFLLLHLCRFIYQMYGSLQLFLLCLWCWMWSNIVMPAVISVHFSFASFIVLSRS